MASSEDTDSTTASEPIAPRPPTPPRETSRELEVSLKSVLDRNGQSDPCSSLQTPPNANTPVSGATNSNLKSRRKRVEWSAHTEYKEHAEFRQIERLIKSSPISALSSRPIKGILKPSPSPNPLSSSFGSDFDGSTGQLNIIEMLDSTIKQLAGSDRDSKLDAYMMLSRALKVSNNLPDRVALQDKMSLFMQFIQRDVTSKTENRNLDTSLINHALTLLATFLHFPAIASTLTSDFGIFILDHSIRAFEDASTPKDVLRHLMQVVAFQNFSAKVMTSDRVGRLVNALYQIENHVTGKSIVMSRIHIYKRLVKQSRSHMVTHLNWLENMFTDMLSTVKDIRSQAISLATEAGFALRSEKQLLRKAIEIFQTTDEDKTYIEFYIHHLQEMLKDKQTSASVPQIWSAVILFMRCPLERWQYYGPWLTLVQSAFNMTDGSTKQEANYAWNRYVCLTLHDSKPSPKVLGTLCQPLISQLRRKVNPKHIEEAMKLRRVVIGGICSLYYYAFAPLNENYAPDIVWDVAVQPIMAQLISLDGKPEIPVDCLMQAGRMLTGLLDVATPRVWRQDRIQEIPPVKTDELPAIDAKWIRRNCDKILQAVGPILEKRFVDLANKDSMTFRLWQALVGSVAAASAKDIKVSEDTAKFFAYTFGLLSKIWTAGSTGNDSLHPAFLPSIQNFINVLVDGLGLLPFTEKRLSMTVINTFEPTATPSHHSDRPDKSNGLVRTPLQHLFAMLCSIPTGGANDDMLADFFLSVFDQFFNGKTPKGRVELAHELLRLLPRDAPSSYGPWILAAQNLRLTLESDSHGPVPSSVDSNKILGPKYRDITSLLERGLTDHPNLPTKQWFLLFERLSEHVARESGDAGRALVIVEPLAKVLLDVYSNSADKIISTTLRATKSLFEIAKIPRDRATLEIARRRLWGIPLTISKGGSSDPFDHLYKLGNQVMELLYNKFSNFDSSDETAAIIEAVQEFVVRCFPQSGVKSLSRLQQGLCLWIQDEQSHLQPGDKSVIFKTVSLTWDRISTELVGRGQLDRSEFDEIEPLLTAAFQSKHLGIVGMAVQTWNALVKDEDDPGCSDSLKSVVSNLDSKVELLAGGAEQSSGEFGAQASSFIRPQGDVSFVVLSSTSSHQEAQQPPPSSVASDSTTTSKRPNRKRRLEATPEATRGKSAKRTATPRLRHDDSQIQFAPIVSSPPPAEEESQHLTERQKEIRERQRENAALYSDQPDTSPIRLLESSRKPSKEPGSKGGEQGGDVTPRRATSYEDAITSSPTPRRGQFLQIDNDPPSSPPVPRPYPLLSEIKSRSKDKGSMENWEFSSPPGTPVTSHQQPPEDSETPIVPTTENAKAAKTKKTRKSRRSRSAKKRSKDVVPSSVASTEEEALDTDMPDANVAPAEKIEEALPTMEEAPTTPKKGRREPMVKAEESPKSVDDEFVDARSSPAAPSSPIEVPDAGNDSMDTSFALSELDDSCMLKLVVELESRRGNPDNDKINESPSKKQQDKKKDTYMKVQGEDSSASASPPPSQKSKKGLKRDISPVVPSTPVGTTEVVAETEARRKRKRSGSKHNGGHEKKRRTESEEIVEPKETPIKAKEQDISPERSLRRSTRKSTSVPGVETRGSARRKHHQQQEEDVEGPRTRASNRKRKQQGGDTDDEVMSQLVTESNAASQEQEQEEEPDDMEPAEPEDATAADEAESEPRAEEADEEEEEKEEEGKDEGKPATLMDMLQTGLKQLRNASLSRDEVYKMEDMLMDMKRELFAAEKRGRRG
ncbi:Telomere length regulator rif1-like protein [Cladobotryum mycophilum]|uniref:Telomere length regulator rif1-like protein n=1 Tax=Cladobotryum mycophilum TaxID=491253 RepID=A0ABR0SLK1_9HYPO